MLAYSEYAYQLGLIDLNAKLEMQELETQGRKAIQDKHFIDAFYVSPGSYEKFSHHTWVPSTVPPY